MEHIKKCQLSGSAEDLPFQMPEHACNSHLHIIDSRFPNNGKAVFQHSPVTEYMEIARELKLERAVFVHAKTFGYDHSCVLDAIQTFGKDKSVGIGTADADITDRELQRLHEGGIRGLRFSLWNPNDAIVGFADCEKLSARIADMGWNVQLHLSGAQFEQNFEAIKKLPSRVVIDHMGRLDPSLKLKDPNWERLKALLDTGNVWVKLACPYLVCTDKHDYGPAAEIASAIAEYAPHRVLWGSDWPHVTERESLDEFRLTALLSDWIPDREKRNLALAQNPDELYFR